MNKRYKQSQDPAEDLLLAIEKLEKFTEQNESESVPHAHHLEVKEGQLVATHNSPLKKTIALVRCFIGSTFSDRLREEHVKKKVQVQEEVLYAIEVVKSHYLLIEKMKKGTAAQRQLAASAMAVINRYNEIMTQASRRPPTWSLRIARFLYDSIGLSIDPHLTENTIQLPQEVSLQFESPKKIRPIFENPETVASSLKVTFFMQKQGSALVDQPISKQEEDAFRMKGITLLRSHGIRFTSVSDELKSIRVAPIQAISTDHSSVTNEIVSMKQTLMPFPGEVIELKGSFKRERTSGRSHCHSIPIPDSFHLSSKSIQTGFPHPSQHTGWALADALIPACPQRLEQLTKWQSLCQRKKEMAQALLPGGRHLLKAKDLLKLKKQCFEENSTEFLSLHQQLSLTLIEAAPAHIVPPETDPIIDRFYQSIVSQTALYEYLSEVHAMILDHFIMKPFEKLKHDWMEGRQEDLKNPNPEIRYQKALSILEEASESERKEFCFKRDQFESDFVQSTFDYILCFGKIFNVPSNFIILQGFSEVIGFEAPSLNQFEQKILIALYKQLHDFLEEVETANLSLIPNQMSKLLKNQLEADILLFKADSLDTIKGPSTQIVEELEAYYQSRF
jgi:hypothetical protein